MYVAQNVFSVTAQYGFTFRSDGVTFLNYAYMLYLTECTVTPIWNGIKIKKRVNTISYHSKTSANKIKTFQYGFEKGIL